MIKVWVWVLCHYAIIHQGRVLSHDFACFLLSLCVLRFYFRYLRSAKCLYCFLRHMSRCEWLDIFVWVGNVSDRWTYYTAIFSQTLRRLLHGELLDWVWSRRGTCCCILQFSSNNGSSLRYLLKYTAWPAQYNAPQVSTLSDIEQNSWELVAVFSLPSATTWNASAKRLFVKSLFQFSPSWHLIWKLREWANCKSFDGNQFFAFIANGSMGILYMYRCTQFTEIIRGIKSNQDRVWESLRSVDMSHPGLS